MTVRLSTGLRNFLNSGGSLKQALNNGRIEVYTGTQPANGDAAVSGTLLCTFTKSSGAFTAEIQTTMAIELTGGASGNISAVTIDGLNILDETVTFDTSLAITAGLLGAALNRSATNLDWTAIVVDETVTLVAKPGLSTKYNGKTLANTLATITTTLTQPSGGAAAINGLQYEDSGSGTMTKRASHTWTGTAADSGTAGWFRHYGSVADNGSADATASALRLDGAIATSGSQMNMSPTSMVAAAVQTLSSFSPTIPAAGS